MASSIVISDSEPEATDVDHQLSRAREKLKKMKEREGRIKKKAVVGPEGQRAGQRAGRRENKTPQERLRGMVVVLGSSLSESSEFMECLVEEMEEVGVELRVGVGGAPGGVSWRRKQRDPVVSEVDEHHLLLTLEAQGFAGLVHYSKMTEQGLPLPVGTHTLEGYIEQAKRGRNDTTTVSIAVEGMDKYFRGSKTKTNRQFRQQVLGAGEGSTTPAVSDVSWLDCQEAIVSLQLNTGCSVRLCSGPEELTEHVITLTKAVCEKPFRKESHFSFHPEAATSGLRKRAESGDQVGTTWRNQLMQFNNLSQPMAAAVVAAYPSPAHLISAYSSVDRESAALLLKDITVRRGVGTVSSTRRLGPVQSRRIHTLLTTPDPQVTIT